MRMIFGMILGAVLTVGAAFVYDSWATGRSITATTGSTATTMGRPMVNWDVVGENWQGVRQRARDAWMTLSQKVQS